MSPLAPVEVLAQWTFPKPVLHTINTLKKHNYQAWLVGGSVRDILRQHSPKDFDITTDARPWEVRKIFARARVIGKRFPIVHVRHKDQLMEISTLRNPDAEEEVGSKSKNKRRGTTDNDRYGNNIDADILGRDYTINALYYDPIDVQVRGHLHSYNDIQNRRIRSITNPDSSFRTDPVRMLRALYFSAKLDFSIDDKLAKAIRAHNYKITSVPGGRMNHELNKVFTSGHSGKIWSLMGRYGFLSHLFPDLAPLIEGSTADKRVSEFIERLFVANDCSNAPGVTFSYSFLMAALLWYPLCAHLSGHKARNDSPSAKLFRQHGSLVLDRQHALTVILWRQKQHIINVWSTQKHLLACIKKSDTERILQYGRSSDYRDGVVLLGLRAEVEPELQDCIMPLRKLHKTMFAQLDTMTQNTRMPKRRRGRSAYKKRGKRYQARG